MAYTKKGFINPQIKTVINKVYTKPIIMKYDYMVEEIFIHYFISIVGRIIGLNKCSVGYSDRTIDVYYKCSKCNRDFIITL
jgi:hypothetical protein